jgi:LmbE family N-acetylglucosaminyl deacetylase
MSKKLNILALSPHADDVEIAMGGTIAKYVDEGHNVTIITAILPKENADGKIDDFMSKNRIEEQENSAKILGAKVDILDLDPYDFFFNRKYIKMFDEKINKYKPDLIFSCWEHDTHQDHKNLSDILFAVTRKNNISINMYEVMLPGGLNTYSFNPQYFINISKYIDVKIASIKSYKSVFEKKHNNYSRYFDSIVGRAKFRGEVIGVDYAEAFVVAKKIEI